MTTNSPNTVDGDVQALIELAKRISNTPLKVISETVVCPGVYSSITSAEIHSLAKVALAALTAEPDVMISEDGADAIRAIINCEISAAGRSVTFKRPSGIGEEKMMPLYTTPPAQLLRPVELPDCVDDLHGVGPVMSADAVVEALRQQGYEVKND